MAARLVIARSAFIFVALASASLAAAPADAGTRFAAASEALACGAYADALPRLRAAAEAGSADA